MAAQQFSLRWNNYSQHIVTALEELRVDDELTDVTLSCEGQRVKAHKLLLSACSVFFKDTFKENPCKHPVIILKGVSFSDLQAIVQFMYNGQVNVTQERLPSFLQTAEILQIKGLTDSTNNERDETPVTKKRPQTFPSQAPATSDSLRQDTDARPPTPKRKRILGSAGTGVFASAQNSELPGSASVISATTSSGVVTGGSSSSSSSHSNSNQTNSLPPPLIARANSENSGDGLPVVKYEDQDQEADDILHYDRSALSEDNDNSFQDGIKDELGGDASLGSNIRSTNGAGERRPRYTLQPSNDQVTGVVDATNDVQLNGTTSRDLICDKPLSYVADMRKVNNFVAATNGHCSKIKSRLTSRSLSSTALLHAQQEDRVIKYAPMQQHSQDSGSNSSHDGGDPDQPDDVSESPQGSDEDDEPHNRSSSSSLLQKGRGMPHLVKAFHISQQQSQQINTIVNSQSHGINGSNGIYRGISASLPNVRGAINKSNLVADDLTVSSPSDISTPNFSLTQQLLQQNVLSMISSNGSTTDVLKGGSSVASGGSNSSSRVSAIAVQPLSQNVMVKVEQPIPIVAPYVCDVCGKRYVHHRSLNDHKKSHTGATRCPVCNKSFSKVANMRAHYAAQHGNQQDEEGMDQTQQQNGHLPVN